MSAPGSSTSRLLPFAGLVLAGAFAFALVVAVQSFGPPPAGAGEIRQALPISGAASASSVREALKQAGFQHVSNVRQRGQTFAADVELPGGAPAQVVVHGTSGQIIGMRLVDRFAKNPGAEVARR